MINIFKRVYLNVCIYIYIKTTDVDPNCITVENIVFVFQIV